MAAGVRESAVSHGDLTCDACHPSAESCRTSKLAALLCKQPSHIGMALPQWVLDSRGLANSAVVVCYWLCGVHRMASTGLSQLPDDIVATIVVRAFRSGGATLQAHLNMSLVCRCGRVNATLKTGRRKNTTRLGKDVTIRCTVIQPEWTHKTRRRTRCGAHIAGSKLGISVEAGSELTRLHCIPRRAWKAALAACAVSLDFREPVSAAQRQWLATTPHRVVRPLDNPEPAFPPHPRCSLTVSRLPGQPPRLLPRQPSRSRRTGKTCENAPES